MVSINSNTLIKELRKAFKNININLDKYSIQTNYIIELYLSLEVFNCLLRNPICLWIYIQYAKDNGYWKIKTLNFGSNPKSSIKIPYEIKYDSDITNEIKNKLINILKQSIKE